MKDKILIIESSDIGIRYTGEAVQALGCEPVFLCNLKALHGDPRAQLGAFMTLDCDTTSADAIITAIKKSGMSPPTGVFTSSDTRLKPACEVATRLGIPGVDPSILRLKDKGQVAKYVPEFSPASVEFLQPAVPVSAISALFARGRQVILKPTHGAGALGVFCLRSAAEVGGLAERLAAAEVPAYLESTSWIAQAFIEGQLISAEGFVVKGQVSLIGFTGRTKVGSTESTATFPIDHRLPEALREKARLAIDTLVRRSEFWNGYFHIEFMATDDDCFLIDANMGRIGGGAIAEQLAISYGLDPMEVFHHILAVTLRRGAPLGTNPYKDRDRRETHAIFYGLERGGVVSEVRLPPSMNCYHTLLVGPGAKVSPMGGNDWAWVGILSGFTRYTTQVIKSIRIVTPDGEFPPCF